MTLSEILIKKLESEDTVTLDGSLFPIKTCDNLREKLSKHNIKLKVNLESECIFDQAQSSQ